MRMLAFPAALVLGVLLYTLFPGAKSWINQRLIARPAIIEQNIIKRRQNPDEKSVLFIYIFILLLVPALISLIHPVAAALVMAPLFPFFALMP